MTTRLTLICHAATSAIRMAAFPLDEPAEPHGLAKAAGLATVLGRVDAAWTSPALRARQTAAALQLDAQTDASLRDIDLGSWAGQRLSDIQAAEPDAVRAWTGEPNAAPHGGESVMDLLRRLSPWLVQRGQDERRAVAVTHASILRAAIVLAIDAPAMTFWRIDVAPLCRVELRGAGNRWTLRSILAGAIG